MKESEGVISWQTFCKRRGSFRVRNEKPSLVLDRYGYTHISSLDEDDIIYRDTITGEYSKPKSVKEILLERYGSTHNVVYRRYEYRPMSTVLWEVYVKRKDKEGK